MSNWHAKYFFSQDLSLHGAELIIETALNVFTEVDIVGPLWESKGMKYIITSVCYFTKFVEAKAIPKKSSIEVARFIFLLFMRYGCMDICISDQDKYKVVTEINKNQHLTNLNPITRNAHELLWVNLLIYAGSLTINL